MKSVVFGQSRLPLSISRSDSAAVALKNPTSASREWKNRWFWLTRGGSLAVLILLAGIFCTLRTRDGTLVVTVDQPDALIQVLDAEGRVEVSQQGSSGEIRISIDPGKHRLKVEKDGFSVIGQEFELQPGAKKSITAKLLPVEPAPVADPTDQVDEKRP